LRTSRVTCPEVARKYEGDQKVFLQSFSFTSGKFLRISLDVIVFRALMYFGMLRVGFALKRM